MTAGDVYSYTPEDRHCMEGLAIENERGKLIDNFWHGEVVWRQVITRDAADLTLIANLGDYDKLGQYDDINDYAKSDRLVITAQHGCQRTYYVRKGATPDLATKIENARAAVAKAEAEAQSAQRHVERAKQELASLLAEANH